MNKEAVFKRLVSPGMALTIGGTAFFAGLVDTDIKIASHDIDSSAGIEQARREILEFDQNVHDLVKREVIIVDFSKIPNYQNAKDAIELVDKGQETAQKINAQERDIVLKRNVPIMFEGSILMGIGAAGILRRSQKREKERQMSIQTTTHN